MIGGGAHWRIPLAVATILAVAAVAMTQSIAQSDKKSPGLFKASPRQRGEPVKIASASLEFRDHSKEATFAGNVHIVQGDLDLRCNTLVVFYEHENSKVGAKKAAGGSQQIRRMEARGSVIITQNHQRAVGDRADFDMPGNTVTLSGNVVVTQCANVLRGQRLIVDMTTGISRMEGPIDGMLSGKSSDGRC